MTSLFFACFIYKHLLSSLYLFTYATLYSANVMSAYDMFSGYILFSKPEIDSSIYDWSYK